MPDGSMLSQSDIDASFELAERQELEPSILAARSVLACATVDLCDAYLGMIRQRYEVEMTGRIMDLAAREQMVRDGYIAECQLNGRVPAREQHRSEYAHHRSCRMRICADDGC